MDNIHQHLFKKYHIIYDFIINAPKILYPLFY